MKNALLILLVTGSVMHTSDGSANDYRLISDCITNGDRYIEIAKNLEKENPHLSGLLITDSEISAIRAAEVECSKRSPDEKVELKRKWQREIAARYGVETPPDAPPPPNTNSFDHYFGPGGLFNPIHVEVR